MNRLLTEEEALESSLRDKENGLDIITIYLKAQDAKTASLVAQEIFKELEALNLMTSETPKVGKACQFLGCYILDWSANKQPTIALNYVIDSEEYQAIKSRWVKE